MTLNWEIEIRPPYKKTSYHDVGELGYFEIKNDLYDLFMEQHNNIDRFDESTYKLTGDFNNSFLKMIIRLAKEYDFDHQEWKEVIFDLCTAEVLENYEILVFFEEEK